MDLGDVLFFLFSLGLVLCGLFFEHRKNRLIHLERMAAIERGLPPASLDERPVRVLLRRGLLWLIPGIGLTMLAWLVSGSFRTAPGGAGVLMACIGTAYLVCCFVETRGRGVQTK